MAPNHRNQHPPVKTTNSAPISTPSNSRNQTSANKLVAISNTVHPFGSTSSISSSSSSRSWADTVKGHKPVSNAPPIAAKSVENLSINKDCREDERSTMQDEGEWETVKPRTRSRISPINSALGKPRVGTISKAKVSDDLKRSSSFTGEKIDPSKGNAIKGNRTTTGGRRHRTLEEQPDKASHGTSSQRKTKKRFEMPSSAVSMPSLSLVEADKGEQCTPSAKAKDSLSAKVHQKPLCKSNSNLQNGPSKNEKVNSSADNASNNSSSSESLEEKSSIAGKKNLPMTVVKNRANGKRTIANAARDRKLNNATTAKGYRKSSQQNVKNNNNQSTSACGDLKNQSMKGLVKTNLSKEATSSAPNEALKSTQNSNKENSPPMAETYPHQLTEVIDEIEEVEMEDVEMEEGENDADTELAENEAAIAVVQEEEESLAREIKETECSQLAEDALDSANEGESDVQDGGDSSNRTTPSKTSREDNISSKKKNGDKDADCKKNHVPELLAAESTNAEPVTPSKYEALFDGLSWVDQIELEEQLKEARMPGRAIEIHEKLSSPARKREPQEAFRHHQEKQNRARVRRKMFQDEKAQRLVALNMRIEVVIAHKEFLQSQRRDMIVTKMAKAEAKRQEHIDGIRKKGTYMQKNMLKSSIPTNTTGEGFGVTVIRKLPNVLILISSRGRGQIEGDRIYQ